MEIAIIRLSVGPGYLPEKGRSEENAALGNRAHHGPGDGWRSVFDPELWWQGLVIGTMGAVSMALLACTVALACDTTGHDWYAAAKLTVADLMIGVGFDEDEHVEFRNADGGVETVTRSGLTDRYRVRWAREDILKSAWDPRAEHHRPDGHRRTEHGREAVAIPSAGRRQRTGQRGAGVSGPNWSNRTWRSLRQYQV